MRAAAYFAVISALALWAGNWIVARAVRDDVAPALITTARALLVMLVLGADRVAGLCSSGCGHSPGATGRCSPGSACSAAGCTTRMQYLGLQYTTATNGTLFFSLSPVTIMVLAGLVLSERVRVMQWIGVAVSLAGVLVIALRGDIEALRGAVVQPGRHAVLRCR